MKRDTLSELAGQNSRTITTGADASKRELGTVTCARAAAPPEMRSIQHFRLTHPQLNAHKTTDRLS